MVQKRQQDAPEQKLINDDGSPAVLELVPDEFEETKSARERELEALEQEISTKKAELADLNDGQLIALKAKEEAKVEAADPWKKQREADERPMRIRFDFREQPGGFLEFAYKKWPGETLKVYKGATRLVDGHVYTLPVGVVKHLMSTGRYPEYKHKRDIEQTDPYSSYEVGVWRTRYTAAPLDFIADEELQMMESGMTPAPSFQG